MATVLTPSGAAVETARAPGPVTPAAGRIPELDGLRGIAILMVVLWHYLHLPLMLHDGAVAGAVRTATNLAWSGVDLFFVLSGFLIGGILLDVRDSPSYFRTFYARRVHRIVPVYAAVCVVFWLTAALGLPERFSAAGWLYEDAAPWYLYGTFTQNFWMARENTFGAGWLGVSWSLAIEEQFYLTLPLILRLVRGRVLVVLLAAVVVGAALLRVAISLAQEGDGYATYVLLPTRADALILGVLAALALRRAAVVDWLAERVRLLRFALAVLVAGFAAMSFANWGIGEFRMDAVGFTWLAVLYLTVLVLALVHREGRLAGLLRWRWLGQVGVLAYGIYLFHQIVIGLVFAVIGRHPPRLDDPTDAALIILALTATFAMAWVSWNFFERPLVRRGHRFRYLMPGGPRSEATATR